MSKQWPRAKLGEVLRRVERFEPRDELTEYPFAGTYSFARGIFVGERKLGSTFALPKIQRVRAGDFIYCKIMAWEGAFGVAPKEADNCVMSGAFVVYELNREKIDEKFLDYFFKVPDHWQSIGSQSTGTNVRRQSLHPTQFERAEIPLPPLEEQRRVVARVEELAAQISEARTLRRQSAEEAAVLVTCSTEKVFADAGKSYSSEPLGTHVKLQGGYAFKSDEYIETGLPIVRIANLENETVHTDGSPCMPENRLNEFSRFVLNPGDILVAMTGATTGKLGIVPENCDTWLLNQRVGRFLPKKPGELEPKYVYWLGRGVQKHIFETAYGGAQPNISPNDIEAMEFPFPPLAEQRRIVAELDALQEQVDALKRLQAETAVELDALLPSILDKAFKGET